MNKHFKTPFWINSIGFASALLAAASAYAQDYYFIDHKPTERRLQACLDETGTVIRAVDDSHIWRCVQWEKIDKGEYFHLKGNDAQKFIAPKTTDSGADLIQVPTSWNGDWTQWSLQDTSDGYGHLVHKTSGKFVFLSGHASGPKLQPSSWVGDYTRWKFTSIHGAPMVPEVDCGNDFSYATLGNDDFHFITISCSVESESEIVDVFAEWSHFPGFSHDITYENGEYHISIPIGHDPDVYLFVFEVTNAAGYTGNDEVLIDLYDGTVVTPPPSEGPTPGFTCTPAPAYDFLLEAEEGEIFGSASTYADDAASGGQGVAFISSPGAGVSVEAGAFNSVTFSVTYASELDGQISYSVNGGEVVGKIDFTRTGAWTGQYNTILVDPEMPPGRVTVEIYYEDGDTPMNVDAITVHDFGGCYDTGTPAPRDNPPLTLQEVEDPRFGTYIIAGDAHPLAGFTLYTFDEDMGGPDSTCYDGCATNWPPLVLADGQTIVRDHLLGLDTSARTDGSLQVTLFGEPLYFYAGDQVAGDANGHGLGNVWWVARTFGPPPSSPPTPIATPSPSGF